MFTSLHLSHVKCHVSRVTCHVSPVTCCVSHVTIFIYYYYYFFAQSGEASLWRVCYQRGLSCLVVILQGKTEWALVYSPETLSLHSAAALSAVHAHCTEEQGL